MYILIIGVNLDSIEAKKIEDIQGNIRIDNNTVIKGVSDVSIPLLKEKVTKIEFQFQTKYSQNKKLIGNINATGNVI